MEDQKVSEASSSIVKEEEKCTPEEISAYIRNEIIPYNIVHNMNHAI